MLMSLPARYWLKRRTMPGWSWPKAVITKRSKCPSAQDASVRQRGPHQHLELGSRTTGRAHPLGQLLGIDRLGQADDHDQREIAAQHGLAARVDIAAQRFHGIADRGHDARDGRRHHVEHVHMFKSTHRLPSRGAHSGD